MSFHSLRLVSLLLFAAFFSACQRDIPVLGEGEGDQDYDSAFLWAITLNQYDTLDPSGMSWDSEPSYLFDSIYYRFPDVFYNIGNYDTTFDFTFSQQTHFLNVTPDTLPLTYQVDPALYIPGFNKPFHLRIYDFELDTPSVDSTFMDSILFVVPDPGAPVPYPPNLTGMGANGASVTISLLWR